MAKGKYSKRRDGGAPDGDADAADDQGQEIVDLNTLDVSDPEAPPKTVVADRPSMTRLYKADPKGGTKVRGGGRVTPSKSAAKPQSKDERRAARIEARKEARSAPRPVAATTAADGARLAPVPSRGFGAIIDLLVVGGLVLAGTGIVNAIWGSDKKGASASGTLGAGLMATSFVIVMLYAVPSVALTGQTLGHRIMKLRVRKADVPGPPGLMVAFRRYVLLAALGASLGQLGTIVALLGGLSFYVFKDGRSVLDRIAKTEVVAYGPERAGSSLWKRGLGR